MMSVAPNPLPPSVAELRAVAMPATDYPVLAFGVSEIDSRLGAGGLRTGALHEATAGSASLVDEAAATLFLAGIAARQAAAAGGPVLWASCRTDLYAPALAQAGLPSADVIFAQPADDAALLAVIEDAVRDGTPSAIVAEANRVSMVATRRLQLVAAEANLPVLLLRRRRGRDQDPFAEPSAAWTRWKISTARPGGRRLCERILVTSAEPSAAWTRWKISTAPSERLEVAGVGRGRWLVELARQRSGASFSLIVEGSDETGRLAVPAELGHRAAETVGAVHSAAA